MKVNFKGDLLTLRSLQYQLEVVRDWAERNDFDSVLSSIKDLNSTASTCRVIFFEGSIASLLDALIRAGCGPTIWSDARRINNQEMIAYLERSMPPEISFEPRVLSVDELVFEGDITDFGPLIFYGDLLRSWAAEHGRQDMVKSLDALKKKKASAVREATIHIKVNLAPWLIAMVKARKGFQLLDSHWRYGGRHRAVCSYIKRAILRTRIKAFHCSDSIAPLLTSFVYDLSVNQWAQLFSPEAAEFLEEYEESPSQYFLHTGGRRFYVTPPDNLTPLLDAVVAGGKANVGPLLKWAVRYKHMDVILFTVREYNVRVTVAVTCFAAELGDLDNLKFLIQQSYTSQKPSKKLMEAAAKRGHLHVMEYLHSQRGLPWTTKALCAAVKVEAADSFECTLQRYQDAALQGAAVEEPFAHMVSKALVKAASVGLMTSVVLLHSKGATISEEALNGAARRADRTILAYLYENAKKSVRMANLSEVAYKKLQPARVEYFRKKFERCLKIFRVREFLATKLVYVPDSPYVRRIVSSFEDET